MSSCGAGGRCVWVEMRNPLAARPIRYDGEATMLEFKAIFSGSCDNVKAEDWSALGMARALSVARWPKGAKEAFSEKVTPGASSLLARQWVPRPRRFSLNIFDQAALIENSRLNPNTDIKCQTMQSSS